MMVSDAKAPQSIQSLRELLLAGDRVALARAITLVENNTVSIDELVPMPVIGKVPIVGLTGAPGVGKSTLIGALIHNFRGEALSVAVLSIDPSSPISGGAMLGDRARLGDHILDDGVFIRSLASRGHIGGLCKNIGDIIAVLKASGIWDIIILETVGTGQSEVEVARFADFSVVVTVPNQGDYIQFMKAGILEIADIFVANKADLPEASMLVRDLRLMSKYRTSPDKVPIFTTVATKNTGITELAASIKSLAGLHGAPTA